MCSAGPRQNSQPACVMMYPASPGSGDSPEGFSEQQRLQPRMRGQALQALPPGMREIMTTADAFLTCRKNVLAKSSPPQAEGEFALSPEEEREGLLQQWREEEANRLLSPAGGGACLEKGLARGEGSLALLMASSVEQQDVASEDKWSSVQLSDLRTLVLGEPYPGVQQEEGPFPKADADTWVAIPTPPDRQFPDCEAPPEVALCTDQWEEGPAVASWSLAPELGPEGEASGWPFEGLEYVPAPSLEVPYHEILWREWEELSPQPEARQGLPAGNCSPFQFTVMSYNILAQDLVHQCPELYLHCHPDVLNWDYRFANLLQEFQHWDPDILCLQEVQEDHYWEQLEPALRMMGFTSFYKRRTRCKTDGCAICYKHTRFRLLSSSPVEYFRPGLELLNRDNVGLVLLLQPLVPESSGPGATGPLCVANTHLLYNPRRGDIKLAQIAILLAEVDKMARLEDDSYCPIILCGDLNSVPNSPLYDFIRKGRLRYRGIPVWKVSGQEDFSHQLYQRKLSTPLWPSSLGISDSCQYTASCLPKIAEKRKYNRDFLLSLRFCDIACQRPMGLVLLEGVTDATSERPKGWSRSIPEADSKDLQPFLPSTADTLQHSLRLTSVYSHFLPQQGCPEVTTVPLGLGATVDYIFFSAKPSEDGPGASHDRSWGRALKLLGRLSLLSEEVIWAANGLPNPFCSSDHLCLLASFEVEVAAP
ncbi:protein angel homolog 1 isoform X2 [Tachyglossus aculeatus]|uniref:protein angel homolog 1 isoform X2 n=2 Tax=Tachyglossus aculeatus TaxID=9261 RepID=UPI0018F30DC9|nr:protein angel homolog 1 isoform X2 [Tachyglossus aculeatus]